MQSEIIIFIIIVNVVLLLLITGIVLFIFQYRKRRMMHDEEKESINQNHRQELLSTQLHSQQQTMQHIGREIHDNVGQKLTLASLYMKQIPKEGSNEKINTVNAIIDESLAELRSLSKTLINPQLANAGIAELLKEEAMRINASGICHIAIKADEESSNLTAAQKNILLRLLQEFIQNSMKHSGCRKINISLQKKDEALLVTASDDGKGFDTATASTGIGLHNMRRRAEELEAQFELTSEQGNGTMLTLKFNPRGK